MFANCKTLVYIPDISKWKISPGLIPFNNMFLNCQSLSFIPDIYNWNKYPWNQIYKQNDHRDCINSVSY